jgi:hypothetical protein
MSFDDLVQPKRSSDLNAQRSGGDLFWGMLVAYSDTRPLQSTRAQRTPAKLTKAHKLSARTQATAIGGHSWLAPICRFSGVYRLPQPPGYFPGDRLASTFWSLRKAKSLIQN